MIVLKCFSADSFNNGEFCFINLVVEVNGLLSHECRPARPGSSCTRTVVDTIPVVHLAGPLYFAVRHRDVIGNAPPFRHLSQQIQLLDIFSDGTNAPGAGACRKAPDKLAVAASSPSSIGIMSFASP